MPPKKTKDGIELECASDAHTASYHFYDAIEECNDVDKIASKVKFRNRHRALTMEMRYPASTYIEIEGEYKDLKRLTL